MRIAVLCSGPSLTSSWSEGSFHDYGLVIAINGAILNFRAHWAACNDRAMSFSVIKARKRGELPDLSLLMSCYVWAAKRLGLDLHLPPLYGDRIRYSLPNVVHLTCLLYAPPLSFEFFGYDASPDIDFDGKWGDHSPDRWRKELKAVKQAIRMFGAEAKGLPQHVA